MEFFFQLVTQKRASITSQEDVIPSSIRVNDIHKYMVDQTFTRYSSERELMISQGDAQAIDLRVRFINAHDPAMNRNSLMFADGSEFDVIRKSDTYWVCRCRQGLYQIYGHQGLHAFSIYRDERQVAEFTLSDHFVERQEGEHWLLYKDYLMIGDADADELMLIGFVLTLDERLFTPDNPATKSLFPHFDQELRPYNRQWLPKT